MKRFFSFILIIFCIWLYVQYRNHQAASIATRYFEEKKYTELLNLYEKITPDNLKPKPYPLKQCFFKALALQNTNKEKEAIPYWDFIVRHSTNNFYKMHAYLYLGITAIEEKNYDYATGFFKKNELMDPLSELYPQACFHLAQVYYLKNDYDKAINLLRPLLKNPEELSPVTPKIKALAGEINIKRIFSRRITSNSVDHMIKPGETLATISENYNANVELIKKTNSLSSSVIRPHNHLKIVTSQFSIRVNKTRNILTVLENGEFFKEYPVGTGRENVTPIGKFYIVDKQVHPTWFKHDGQIVPFGSKENLLGTRWMSINYPGYGIHGTWDDDSVGKQSSAGCIRLRNADVEELFLYTQLNTPVDIIE